MRVATLGCEACASRRGCGFNRRSGMRSGGEGGGLGLARAVVPRVLERQLEAQATRHAKAGWLHDGGVDGGDPYAAADDGGRGQQRARGEMVVDYTPSVRDGTHALPMDAPPVERPGPTLYHPTTQTGATAASPEPCPEEPQTYLLAPELPLPVLPSLTSLRLRRGRRRSARTSPCSAS